jgi:hypothetical protein
MSVIITVELPDETIERLEAQAKKYQLTVHDLASQIVENELKDGPA